MILMIYLFDDVGNINNNHLKNAYEHLSKERVEKVKRYRFSIDKKISAMTELLLQYALEKEYGISEKVEIMRTSSGKPFLKDRSEEHTSELQSRGHLVCRLLLEKK